VLVWCKVCRHQAEADLEKLVDEGKGDVPLIHLKYEVRPPAHQLQQTASAPAPDS